MGGYFSGRRDGRPIVELCHRIDIRSLIRNRRIGPGRLSGGVLSWTYGGEPSGWVSYRGDMIDLNAGKLDLEFVRTRRGVREDVRQTIRIVSTRPNFGGLRWWMLCPVSGIRVAKLYRPHGGDVFASRAAWRLGYRCQRADRSDRPFEALFRLQRRLGGDIGWDAGLPRKPKGMWRRTYERYWADYERLAVECDATALARFAHSL